MRILGFGDSNVDINAHTGESFPGGNCVNVAVFAARDGADAAFAGVFGSDVAGRRLREAIEAEGVDTAHCEVREGETGCSVFTVEAGDRRFIRSNRGGVVRTHPLEATPAILAHAAGSDVVHSSVYSSSERELPALRQAADLISYDFSNEPEYRSQAYLAEVAPFVDVALLSCADLDDAGCTRLLERVAAYGPAFVIATLGADGARVLHAGTHRGVDAIPVPVSDIMDSMGCGDAFVSAFLAELVAAGWRRGRVLTADQTIRAMTSGIERASAQLRVRGAFDRAFTTDRAFTADSSPEPAS